MPLYYALVENHMTPDPNDRSAIAMSGQTYSMEDVMKRATNRGSTVTRAEMLSVWEELTTAIVEMVKEGNSVNTSIFKIGMSIVGVFDNDDDSFNASEHQVKLRITPGIQLRGIESGIPVEKTKLDKKIPVLSHFHDTKTESLDSVISPNGGARITGSLLKFDEADAAQGVFFINQANGTEVKVAGKFLRNKPGELIFLNPPLAAGVYRVEVRMIVKGTQGLRVGSFSDDLTVS